VRTRVGIELTPLSCRAVEVTDRGWTGRSPGGETVVRSFGVWPAAGVEAAQALAPYRRKPAAVIVWGVPNEHHQVEVAVGSYEGMRAEALRILDDAGVPTRGAWADIAPAGAADHARRPVIVTVAAASAMTTALQPLIDAGFRVRTAVTPAAALAGLARARRTSAMPEALEVYVALDEMATCLALIRDGLLMAARELSWGFLDDHGVDREPRRSEDIVARLGDELADFFAMYEEAGRVRQVCICGALPELRSTTLPLMERLDVEVETLDSLFGIDAQRVPEPADMFRSRAAELRLAWAAAADWTTINLLRLQRRRWSQVVLARAAVVAGVVFGFVGAWSITQDEPPEVRVAAARAVVHDVPRSPSPTMPRSPAAAAPLPPLVREPVPMAPIIQDRTPIVPLPAPEPPKPPIVAKETAVPPAPVPNVPAAPIAIARAPIAEKTPSAAAPPAREVRRVMPSVVQEPPRLPEPKPIVPVSSRPIVPRPPPPIRTEPPAIRQEPAIVRSGSAARGAPAAGPRATVDDQSALPFEAVLTGILFSPDRQLAIIDGRIVGRGDDVRGAIVVDVTPTIVLLRDPQGRLRRLSSPTGSGR